MLGAFVKSVSLPSPEQLARNPCRQTDRRINRGILVCVFDFNFTVGVRHSCSDVLERAEIRLNYHGAESGAGGTNSRHDGEQIVVRMGAPGVGIGTRRLRLFCPGSQAKSQHVSPGLQERNVFLAHASMLQGAREIEAKIVSGLGHWGQRRIALESGIADGKKLGECSLLLRLRDDVEPYAKN